MTEAEWVASTDPQKMLDFLQVGIIALVDELPSETERQAMRRFLLRNTIPRKLALFACACCREIWQGAKDVRSRKAVEVAEQYIDDLADEHQLENATLAAHDARNAIEHQRGDDRAETHIRRTAANACWEAASAVRCARGFGSCVERTAQECADVAAWTGLYVNFDDARAKQTQFLRCIVGNPFLSVFLDQTWLTPKVVALAQNICEKRVFNRMRELAAALEEADCTNADILDHCHQAGPHVRGCWVVDLLLGKE